MVSTFQMQTFFNRQHSSLEPHSQVQKYEEDDSVLDDNILDNSGMDSGLEMSPPMADSRRDSFAVGPPLFSPKTEAWSVDMQSVPSNNPFLDNQSNNPFMRMDQAQAAVYGSQSSAWSMSASGACTPMQQFDGMPAGYDAAHATALFQRGLPNQAGFGGPQMGLFGSLPVNSPSMPASPQKEWMGQGQSMIKKNGPGSPLIRSHNEMRRGDGIRKKNARFDIPAERTLSNIDNLIAACKNEADLKELKQQKRLLRNRQAALDSRQRKKQHTERLEDEKKQFTALVTDLEEEIVDLRSRIDQLLREKQSYSEYIESMNHEKEEMIRSHTIETGELRKKVSVLTDHVQRLESSGIASSVSSGYSSGYDEMEGIAMPGSWDSCNFLDNFGVDSEVKQEPVQQLVPTKKNEISFPTESEKPSAQGGLLFMLFLVGAFVLSSRSVPAIPRVSEDVRVASASLLESVLKDAGVGAQAAAAVEALAPQPSGNSWSNVPAMSVSEPAAVPSALGDLGDSLSQPTQEQTNEQIFSMSAAQYNGVNSQDFMQNPPERSTSQGRKNLADALAAIRNGGAKQNGAADVYTRSLLWDQIPNQVVRDFAKMMADCSSSNNDSNQNEQQCSNEAAVATS